MAGKVLDSHALVAFFRDDAGAEAVESLLVAASKKDTPLLLSDVSYAEVKCAIVRKDGPEAWNEASRVLQGLPIEVCSTSRALADAAGTIKAHHEVSLADAFAAALAKEKKAELVTGDQDFKELEKEIKIHWLPATS